MTKSEQPRDERGRFVETPDNETGHEQDHKPTRTRFIDMKLTRPDRKMLEGIVVIVALVVLAWEGVIEGGVALAGILGVAASLRVYQAGG